jgi:glycosyltransferase involved in cell wall biosynthesis
MPERIAVIIPALDEQAAIGSTLDGLRGVSLVPHTLAQIIVADNGSRDRTADVAAAHGAQVVSEPQRGYGAACLSAMAALLPEISIVAFMDADASDDPSELPSLIQPIAEGTADFVLGSRVLGERERGALSPQQQFGNKLATRLMRFLIGARFTDLGPFRAIRREALGKLHMQDKNYGWTIEMQIKAHRAALRILEIPVRYRKRRAGTSKVSGSLRGTIGAGWKILWTITKYVPRGKAPA